jgi:hypothetical protein
MTDLLDLLQDPNGRALSKGERDRIVASLKKKKTGHAWTPGTGPAGETCKTCKHYVIKKMAKDYRKCFLMKAFWTGGPGTDIKAGDPACKKWEMP